MNTGLMDQVWFFVYLAFYRALMLVYSLLCLYCFYGAFFSVHSLLQPYLQAWFLSQDNKSWWREQITINHPKWSVIIKSNQHNLNFSGLSKLSGGLCKICKTNKNELQKAHTHRGWHLFERVKRRTSIFVLVLKSFYWHAISSPEKVTVE